MMSVDTRKDLISIHNTKYLLPSVILYLNAEVGGVNTVKDKKRKNIKIKTTKANRKQQQKNKYYCQAGIRTTIACVESEDHSHWSIVSYG